MNNRLQSIILIVGICFLTVPTYGHAIAVPKQDTSTHSTASVKKPKTPAECLDIVNAARTDLLHQYRDAMRNERDYDRMVSGKVAAAAMKCASRFSPDALSDKEIMDLARLYMEANQPGKAEEIVARRLSAPGLSDAQRADIRVQSIKLWLDKKEKSEACQQGRRLAVSLDAMGAQFLLQQLKAYRTLTILCDEKADSLKQVATRYTDLYARLNTNQKDDDFRFGLYKAYSDLASLSASQGDYAAAEQTLQRAVQEFTNDPMADTYVQLTRFDLGRYELVGQPAPPIEADYWLNAKPANKSG
jgi:tetratricopeptide (TPR) repeat protein